ncbi:hypothetical protein GCM10020367_19830 [Streptomyces sannanensis]|uniref:DUF7800 domain-containing protein n=1 Tax=Streptomyces sannanensis TaxID=285536 RepID=A0ABP6S8S5_9ACTN
MAAGPRLGPLLRYVDRESGSSATVRVEADRPCTAEVRCAGGAVRTFQIEGHHHALMPVTGLTPGSETPHEVLLDGRHRRRCSCCRAMCTTRTSRSRCGPKAPRTRASFS